MTRYRGFVSSTGAVVIVPEENEKSEPFSNRKQVRIFLIWWAMRDSNPHWSGYENVVNFEIPFFLWNLVTIS